MDEFFPGGISAEAQAGATELGTADAKAYQALMEEAEALRERCRKLEAANTELEDKCDFLLRSDQPAGGAAGSSNELTGLREANERLKEENRRIMEETMVFLEEGTALRTEAENYRKKMETAEAAVRKARLEQEDLLEANRDLAEKNDSLEKQLEDSKTQGGTEAIMDNASIEAMEKELEETKSRLADTSGDVEQLKKEKEELQQEVELLNGLLDDADTGQGDAEEGAAQEIAALQAGMKEAEERIEQLAQECEMLQKELSAAKETVKINTPMLENISSIQAADMDLGKIFLATVKEAEVDDLDALGRLMQAMNKDAIKSSDKRMLMDIIKRIVK